jgi:uncharacterized cupin superfamily protein
MSEAPAPKAYLSAAEIAASPGMHIRHPWNPNSDVTVKPLSGVAGLARVVLSLSRVPPGKESFLYHSHEREEEFLYILSGHGRAEIDGKFYEVGPGDFMGFTAPGPAHHLVNTSASEDLVYLMGGERTNLEIGHFPRLGRKMVFSRSGIYAMSDADVTQMTFADYMAEKPQS